MLDHTGVRYWRLARMNVLPRGRPKKEEAKQADQRDGRGNLFASGD